MSASMNVIDNISIDSHMLALQRIARKQDGRIQIGQNEIAVPFVYEINTNSQLSEISWARERPPCAIVSRVSGDDSEHSDSTFGYNNVCVKGCGMPDVEMWKSDSRPGQRKKSNKSKVENADIRKNRKSSNRKDVPSDMVSKSPGEIVNALLPEEHAEEREPHQLEYRPVAYLQQAVRYSDTSLNVNHLTSESRFTEKHQPSETICRPHVLYNHSSTDNTFTEKHQPNETNCRPHLHYNHFSTENTFTEKHQPNETKCRPNMHYNHIPTENSFKEKHQPYETKCRPKMHSNHIPTENTFTEKHQQKHQPNETLCRPNMHYNHISTENTFTEKYQQKHQPKETKCRPNMHYNHISTENTFTEKHQANETKCRPNMHYSHNSTENTFTEKHQPYETKCRPNMHYNHISTENTFTEKHQPNETKCRSHVLYNHIPTENTFTEKHQQKHQPNETFCRPNMHYNHISTENTFTEKHQQKHQPNETLCRPHKYEGSCMFSSSEASPTTSSPPKYNRTSIETTFHKNLLKRTLFKTDEVHLLGNKNDTTKLTKPPSQPLVNANQGINSSPSCFESIWTSKLTFKQTEDKSHRATKVEGQDVNESIKSLDNSGAYKSSETLEIGIKPEVSEKCYHRLKSKNYEDFSIYFKAKGEQGQVINPSNATIPSHQPVDEAEYHVSATEERPDNPKAIRFTPIYAETNFRAVERVVKPEAKRLDSCARRADGFRVHGPTGDSLWNRINTDNNQRINGPTNYFSLKHHDRKILLEGSGDFPGGLAYENTKKDSQETENARGVNHISFTDHKSRQVSDEPFNCESNQHASPRFSFVKEEKKTDWQNFLKLPADLVTLNNYAGSHSRRRDSRISNIAMQKKYLHPRRTLHELDSEIGLGQRMAAISTEFRQNYDSPIDYLGNTPTQRNSMVRKESLLHMSTNPRKTSISVAGDTKSNYWSLAANKTQTSYLNRVTLPMAREKKLLPSCRGTKMQIPCRKVIDLWETF